MLGRVVLSGAVSNLGPKTMGTICLCTPGIQRGPGTTGQPPGPSARCAGEPGTAKRTVCLATVGRAGAASCRRPYLSWSWCD